MATNYTLALIVNQNEVWNDKVMNAAHKGSGQIVVVLINLLLLIAIIGGLGFFLIKNTNISVPQFTSQIIKPKLKILSRDMTTKEVLMENVLYQDSEMEVVVPKGWYIWADEINLTNQNYKMFSVANVDPNSELAAKLSPFYGGKDKVDYKNLFGFRVLWHQSNKNLEEEVAIFRNLYINSPLGWSESNAKIDSQNAIRAKTILQTAYYVKHPTKNYFMMIYFSLDFNNNQNLINQFLSTMNFR